MAVIRHNGQHVYARSEFILTPKALAGLPVVWYGAVHVDPRQVGAVQRALFNSYPTVTVINIADVIETVQGVVQQITVVVRFLAAFSILVGSGDSGLEYCQHTIPQGARGSGAERRWAPSEIISPLSSASSSSCWDCSPAL